jgi:hypothetical protein
MSGPHAAGPLQISLFGSSEMEFTEGQPSDVFARLLEAELRRRRPDVAWQVRGHVVYQSNRMASRCKSLAEVDGPRLVMLWLSGNTFSEEFVTAAVHRRSRRLAALAEPWLMRLEAAGGGGTEGAPSPRGLLVRFPRDIAARLIGRAPWVDPEEALAATIETIRTLHPRWPLVCRLAHFNYRQEGQRESVRRMVDAYNDAVRAECVRLAIPCFEPSVALEERGEQYVMTADQLHADLPTRRASAEVCADFILSAMDAAAQNSPTDVRESGR